jgi:transglutaminase-like putative cysteine protease
MTITYRVTHRTEYTYDEEVSSSYGQLRLLPRELADQRCRESEVVVEPVPEEYRVRGDYFGNRVSYFAIHSPHDALTVTASSVVEVGKTAGGFSRVGNRRWEEVVAAVRAGRVADPLDSAEYVLDSPLVETADRYRTYAAESFTPGRPLIDAVMSLSSRIKTDFAYEPGSTSVTTPLVEMFEQRRGVCQDFAHLGIACLRSLGLPARYVSGYLETDPPPGRAKLSGVDGSHAWLSVLVPEAGWLDFDPTNDQFVGGRYVVIAYGRDYSDVPPMNGVIYTEGKTDSLKVVVDVVKIAG